MAASFDGGAGMMIPTHVRRVQHTAGDIKYHLQTVLLSKGEQLEQAATLGQRVLAQQMELEERIRQLQDMDADKADDDEVDPETTERYRDLVDTIQAWDAENAHLSSTFAGDGVSLLPCFPF
jgi:ATPase subunit of ABC transporter with duplicated ATPase domains